MQSTEALIRLRAEFDVSAPRDLLFAFVVLAEYLLEFEGQGEGHVYASKDLVMLDVFSGVRTTLV